MQRLMIAARSGGAWDSVGWFQVQNRRQRRDARVPLESPDAAHHFVQHRTEAKYIAPAV